MRWGKRIMKKLALVLFVLIIAAAMSYAGTAQIGSVKSFNGDVRVRRGTQLLQICNGFQLYDYDKIVFLTSGTTHWVEIVDEVLPNNPTYTIKRTDVPATHIIYWYAWTNSLLPTENGGDGTLLIADEAGFDPVPRGEIYKD
jgi:hypothetical protein